jgi:hypothetical protein
VKINDFWMFEPCKPVVYPSIDFGFIVGPSFSWLNRGNDARSKLGIRPPKTATSVINGAAIRLASISVGKIFAPPDMIISFLRSVMNKTVFIQPPHVADTRVSVDIFPTVPVGVASIMELVKSRHPNKDMADGTSGQLAPFAVQIFIEPLSWMRPTVPGRCNASGENTSVMYPTSRSWRV